MPRRVSLPGADELFRTTGGATLQAPQPRQHPGGAAQDAAQGDPRQRPAPDGAEQARPADAPPAQRSGSDPRDAREPRDGGRDGARDAAATATAPAQRRPIGERPAAAAAAAPAVSAVTSTVSPHVPPVTPGVTGVAAKGAAAQQSPQPSQQAGRRKAPRPSRRPSGRERHDEKITVYVSAEELMDLEHARLVLRGEHGLAIDRGRIVREAVAVVLADLESRGDASILVRRLRGR